MSRKKELFLYVCIFVFVFLLVFGCTRVFASDIAIFEADGDSIRFTDNSYEVVKKLLPDQISSNSVEAVYTFVDYAVNFVSGNTIGAAQSVVSEVAALYDAATSTATDILDFFADWTISDDGIVKYGRNGKFREINDEAMRLHGLSAGTANFVNAPFYWYSQTNYFSSTGDNVWFGMARSDDLGGHPGWQAYVICSTYDDNNRLGRYGVNGATSSSLTHSYTGTKTRGAWQTYNNGSNFEQAAVWNGVHIFDTTSDAVAAFFGGQISEPGGPNGAIILNNDNPNNSVNIRALPKLPTNQIVINHNNDSVGFPTSQTQNINIDYTFSEPYYPASDPIDYELSSDYDYQNLDVNFDSYEVPQGVHIVQDFWDHTPSEVTTYIIACMSISACFMFFRG